jgi:hypothetical protein
LLFIDVDTKHSVQTFGESGTCSQSLGDGFAAPVKALFQLSLFAG